MHHQLNEIDSDSVDRNQDNHDPSSSSLSSFNISNLWYLNLLSKKCINSKPKIRDDGCASFISNLAEMQENEYLCDYAIISGDKRIGAHKIILAASSEYFRAAFRFGSATSHTRSSLPEDQTSSLDLTHLGCQHEVLKNVIRSFYTNEIDLCPEHVEDLLLLADYLMFPELRERVETYMLETLDQDTVVLYFQLAKHYKLNATPIQFEMSHMMLAHFHDFFVHQHDVVNVAADTVNNYVLSGFFRHCSPLQVCTFFLNNLETTLEYSESGDHGRFTISETKIPQLFSLLHEIINKLSSCHISSWSGLVIKYINEWKSKYDKEIKNISCLEQCLKNLSALFEESLQQQTTDVSAQTDSDNLNNTGCKEYDHSAVMTQSSKVGQEPNDLSDTIIASPKSSKILVLVAPSGEMSAQLMAPEQGKSRPLVRFPQLEISLYDIEMGIWRFGGTIDLPVVGAMLDKHAWRVAFLDNCLYMFSMFKQVALEYNILEKRWASLTCKEPFKDHDAEAPVKSVIPVAVAGKLIVLSMSKKSRTDGTHSAQQRFYEMQPEKKSFSLVSVVEDSDMEVPLTQWTVSGDMLVSLKASSMMYRQLSQLQYIHCYNAGTRKLSSHKISCTMESGIKMLVRDSFLYLLDNSGWYRSYNLDTKEWTGVTRYPEYSQFFAVKESADTIYPALSRVTCHAGTSRWQASTVFEPVKARLQELNVGTDGELTTLDHTPPPHEFLTAMCAASMDTDKLWTFHQAKFEYSCTRPKQSFLLPQVLRTRENHHGSEEVS